MSEARSAGARAGWLTAAAIVLSLGLSPGLSQANSEVVGAAERGDFATVEAALKKSGKATAAEVAADGSTVLMWAAHWGNAQLVSALLAAGADVRARTRYGVSALSEAAANPSGEVTSLLLKAGADPNSAFGQGETALMTAAYSGNLASAAALVEAGADVNARDAYRGQTALMWAAGRGHADVVQLLLEHGAEVNAKELPIDAKLPRLNQAGAGAGGIAAGEMSALLFASREGHLDAVKALAERGADLDATDAAGWTPLTLAILNTHYDTAAYLAEKGADPRKANQDGRTPLYLAVEMRLPDVGGPRPLRPENDRLSSLDLAARLLEAGADPNALLTRPVDIGIGGTAFMRAVRGGDLDMMEVLLTHGAKPDLTRPDGANAIMVAAGFGRTITGGTQAQPQIQSPDNVRKAIERCIALGLDVNAVSTDGDTAAHSAAMTGNANMLRVLAAHGGRLDARNKAGITPMDVAEGKGVGARGRPNVAQPAAAAVLKELLAAN